MSSASLRNKAREKKAYTMSKRASYIGREYNPDSLDRAIKEQIIKLRSGLGSGFG